MCVVTVHNALVSGFIHYRHNYLNTSLAELQVPYCVLMKEFPPLLFAQRGHKTHPKILTKSCRL
jgi:hypothetical protein